MSARPVLVVPFGNLSPGERAGLLQRCRNARPVLPDELFSGSAEGDWEAGLRLVAGVVVVPVATSGGRLFVARRQVVLADFAVGRRLPVLLLASDGLWPWPGLARYNCEGGQWRPPGAPWELLRPAGAGCVAGATGG